MKKAVLEALVLNAEVLNIESDERSFTHKTDEHALLPSHQQNQNHLKVTSHSHITQKTQSEK